MKLSYTAWGKFKFVVDRDWPWPWMRVEAKLGFLSVQLSTPLPGSESGQVMGPLPISPVFPSLNTKMFLEAASAQRLRGSNRS